MSNRIVSATSISNLLIHITYYDNVDNGDDVRFKSTDINRPVNFCILRYVKQFAICSLLWQAVTEHVRALTKPHLFEQWRTSSGAVVTFPQFWRRVQMSRLTYLRTVFLSLTITITRTMYVRTGRAWMYRIQVRRKCYQNFNKLYCLYRVMSVTMWRHCDLINMLLMRQTGNSKCVWVHCVKAKGGQFYVKLSSMLLTYTAQ